MIENKQFISCVCLTCGVRNNHSSEDGYCQNGHDNWLEYRDVMSKNEFYKDALSLSNLSEAQFNRDFMNNNIKQFQFNIK